METINIRRSVRTFKENPVEKEKLEKLVRAAMQAPSAGNQQPWEFVIVTEREILDNLAAMSPYAGALKKAPAAIVVLGNKDFLRFPENMDQDLGAATQNILLEAVDLDLGAVWLGVHPLQDRIAHVSTALDLPENAIPYCAIPVGYPLKEDANKFVDRFDQSRIHQNKY